MPLLKLVKSKVDFAKKTEEYYNAIRTNIQLMLILVILFCQVHLSQMSLIKVFQISFQEMLI